MNTAAPSVDIANMVLSMLVIIALIFALAWVLKRFTSVVGSNNHLIKIKSVTSLGVKEKLILIEVDNKQLLLGVTAHQINMLHEMESPVEEPSTVMTSPFSDKLKTLLRGPDKWQDPGTSSKE